MPPRHTAAQRPPSLPAHTGGRASPRVWRWAYRAALTCVGFPGGATCKESTCQCRRRSGCRFHAGRPPGEGSGEPLQYPRLEHPAVRGGWWATVLGSQSSRAPLRARARRAGSGHGAPGPLPPQGPRLRVCSQLRAFSLKESCTLRLFDVKPHTTADEVGILLRQREGGSSSPQVGHAPHL